MLRDINNNRITQHRGNSVRNIGKDRLDAMIAYMQGAVRTRCADHPDISFAARDLLGGVNYDWQETPMQDLYDKYIMEGYSEEAAVRQAGISAGHILKRVLIEDGQRIFQQHDAGMANGYTWVGNVSDN